MPSLGYFVSGEEHTGTELVTGAIAAEQAGFTKLWISDHFHPWTDTQGQAPFVWAALGAIAHVTDLEMTTSVTCPTVRIHPAIIAQAAATVAAMAETKSGRARFNLGVGAGEALNEHILGHPWPGAAARLDMLGEALHVIRSMWSGEAVNHDGDYYTVDRARLYTLPTTLPPILVSAFGPKAVSVAAEIADGYINVEPDAEMLKAYRSAGGTGVAQAGVKVCWASNKDEAIETGHKLWANELIPGEAIVELPTPADFGAVSTLVTKEMFAENHACGPDPKDHISVIEKYFEAGFDEVYIGQMGSDQQGMIDFYAREVMPHFA